MPHARASRVGQRSPKALLVSGVCNADLHRLLEARKRQQKGIDGTVPGLLEGWQEVLLP